MSAMQALAGLLVLAAMQGTVYVMDRYLEFRQTSELQRLRVMKAANWGVLLGLPGIFLIKQFLFPQIEASFPQVADAVPTIDTSMSGAGQWMPWPEMLLEIHLLGCAILSLTVLWRYLSTARFLKGAEEGKLMGKKVWIARGLRSPLSFGIWTPRIYIPWSLYSMTDREIEMCLAHEEIHARRGDLRSKVVSLVARAILWFSPISYLSHRRMELLLEVACDRTTMQETKARPLEYGELLLKMIASEKRQLSASMTDANISRRVFAMMEKTNHRPWLTALMMTGLLFSAGVALASVGGAIGDKTQYKISAKIYIDNQPVSSPMVMVLEGETASISQVREDGTDALHMEVIATDATTGPAGGIQLKMRVRAEGNGRTVDARPEIIVAENREGLIEVGTEEGKTFKMKISALRMNPEDPSQN